MKYELLENNMVSIEAASMKVLAIRAEQRYGINIMEFEVGVNTPVRKGFDINYFRVEVRK